MQSTTTMAERLGLLEDIEKKAASARRKLYATIMEDETLNDDMLRYQVIMRGHQDDEDMRDKVQKMCRERSRQQEKRREKLKDRIAIRLHAIAGTEGASSGSSKGPAEKTAKKDKDKKSPKKPSPKKVSPKKKSPSPPAAARAKASAD